MTTGPFPLRMCDSASLIARWTASGSMPSTFHDGIAKPSARAESRGSAVTSETCVETAYRLFSIKNAIGNFQAAAKFIVSRTEPILTAPSPKYETVKLFVSAFRCAHAFPAASGTPPPTIAFVPRAPASKY